MAVGSDAAVKIMQHRRFKGHHIQLAVDNGGIALPLAADVVIGNEAVGKAHTRIAQKLRWLLLVDGENRRPARHAITVFQQ